jgi:hypothetical protein
MSTGCVQIPLNVEKDGMISVTPSGKEQILEEIPVHQKMTWEFVIKG